MHLETIPHYILYFAMNRTLFLDQYRMEVQEKANPSLVTLSNIFFLVFKCRLCTYFLFWCLIQSLLSAQFSIRDGYDDCTLVTLDSSRALAVYRRLFNVQCVHDASLSCRLDGQKILQLLIV